MSAEDLTCPICLEGGFDRVGLSMHFADCEVAQELADKEHARRRAWEIEHGAKLRRERNLPPLEVSS